MRAIIYEGAGGIEAVRLAERPTPEPGPGQIRVGVRAAGLNRADILQRRGHYPAPPGWPADIPGLEYAGEVESLGAGVGRWSIGDRVMGLVGGGAQAEFVVSAEGEALAVPDGIDWPAAAAIPEAFLTAYDALITRGRSKAGERVLIHAAAGGIGTAAVQVAALWGATVIGTSRSADKLAKLMPLGLTQGIDVSLHGFREQLSGPVDVVLDTLGGPAFADNLAVLRPLGRLVMIGFLAGSAFSGDLGLLLRQRLQVTGTVMRSRGPDERSELAADWRRDLAPGFESGKLRPVVGAEIPFERFGEAHALMEQDALFGKCVLTW
ncbi:MAG: NAD(P)H-quinone oxidoreductase [Gemmatimonadales bacterium]